MSETLDRDGRQAEAEAWLEQHAGLDTLRFITCGGMGDGKSTLIGRMLYEAGLIRADQAEALARDSRHRGAREGEMDFALLLDGLSAEREQGITIDVAYRYFATARRRFIVADTPGHEQYTRNMLTGASTAQAAVIVVDARRGVVTQTRRHAFLCSLLGIRQLVLAVNKMDQVDYAEAAFRRIVADFQAFARLLGFDTLTPIPLSALQGDNIIGRSTRTPWYQGPTLLGLLETLEARSPDDAHPFRLPVQWVNRAQPDFRGLAGTVAAGSVRVGAQVRVLPRGEIAAVQEILLGQERLDLARAGQAVTLCLEPDVEVSRGDLLAAAESPCEAADQFEVDIVWMARESGFLGRSYALRLGTASANAQISELKHKLNIDTLEELPSRSLELNDIGVAKLSLDRDIPFEPYRDCPALGGFILMDRFTHHCVAAGMIRYALRRAKNVHRQKLSVDKQARRRLNGHGSKVLWFTGFSGSGKSTIANALELALHERGIRSYILDGDNVRHGLNKDLGFTDADRVENIRRIAEVARLMVDAGVMVLTAFISPFKAERDVARSLFEADEFMEIFVDTPLEVAEQRDPKGLYKKARRGEIPNFTGINSPYEAPENPEFHLKTEEKPVDEMVDELLRALAL